MAEDDEGDLDLLLSLKDDRVLETPPGSPSSHPPPPPPLIPPDDASPTRSRPSDMSIFRNAVKDYLDTNPTPPSVAAAAAAAAVATSRTRKQRKVDEMAVEKFSGLRIRNQLISPMEISNRFSDIRFVRLATIRNSLSGDSLSGCWATVGVLLDKGSPRVSSAGKSYAIWKMGCLDESDVSVFLFGDSYTQYCNEGVGAVFALFNSAVRRDTGGKGISLSVYSAGQMVKMGTSADYGLCRGKRKDGMPCTMAINKRQGAYCRFHISKASQKYSTGRAELKGGKLHVSYKLQSEGIYMVDPLSNPSNLRKPMQRVKVMSVDGLKRALSNADKVTSSSQSQGIRFLTEVTANKESKVPNKGFAKPNQAKCSSEKRLLSSGGKAASKTAIPKKETEFKRMKTHHPSERKRTPHPSENLIELDIVSSDEEC
ncbi:protein MCM10 homolog isoform X1 [Ananas comosus]|uniref:Protein MCM n=1 Tax=Ananas comosus TaxID=4615 RepID=A0A199VLV0_ANACO|nr:protein MCM10 homolog isoform X1 [Ananas comosus]OAY77705.1 Protein MCM [Ananas comosus]